MGLDINGVLLLIAMRKQGINFGDVLMIGRQDLNIYPAKVRHTLAKAGFPNKFGLENSDTGFAEPLFEALGARSVCSLDAAPFEGSEIIHDLNSPVNDELKQRFDLVYDGGTLEHVFNFPIALQNCMEMVRKGGRFITHTCANNWCGHGFYQFSPELFYSAFSRENGFEVERMIAHIVGPYSQWYEVANPQAIRARVELFNSFPLQLLVQAKRNEIVPLFRTRPQQSDYVPRWNSQCEQRPVPIPMSRTPLVNFLPGVARMGNVLKNGLKFWRQNSLRNRVKFKPVAKE